MAAEPPKWAPSAASPRARAMWEESIWARAKRLYRPDPQILDTYLPVLLESFSYEQFRYCVERSINILPQIDQKGLMTHPFFGGLARAAIRTQWNYIRDGLLQPMLIREKIRAFDPKKAALFDTPSGWVYLIWLTHHLLWLLYDRGRIGQKIEPDLRVASPPGRCPLHQGLCTETAPPTP